MRKLNVIIFILLSACVVRASSGDVRMICEKTGLKVLELQYRDRAANLKKISSEPFEKSPSGLFLKASNLLKDVSPTVLEKAAYEGNKKFLAESRFKTIFMGFTTEKQKLEAAKSYRDAVLSAIEEFVPKEMNSVNWFLKLKEPWVESTTIRPAVGRETGEMYGAVMRGRETLNGKSELEIVFSNNVSESIPYLVPLIIHELQHAKSYRQKINLKDRESEAAFLIVDEAKAFDTQMKTYLAIAKKNPELFCNWMYVTWSYGDILVPLSWTMASMEKEMKSGKFIYDYARQGNYKSETYLLNKDGSDLRADIKEKISALKLDYVR